MLAAAIRCNASVIVTFNEKDFPAQALATYGIEAQHPDLFIDNLFDLDQAAVVAAAQRQRAQLKNPPLDVDHYLDVLLRQGARPDRQGTRNLSRDPVKTRRKPNVESIRADAPALQALLTTIDGAREHPGHEHQHCELCSARGHARLR